MVCAEPGVGEAKAGDLAGIWVYKFKFNRQQYLIAYRPPPPGQRAQQACISRCCGSTFTRWAHMRTSTMSSKST
ncbi:type II toxin-antitoxin system RelE/ParE family toxin [Cupriavidus necator]|uniref:type II toxin-antitoxin system RelE/ParE family toxin n=1 Tax=Cupriavidus necator TaxID=106590 RepID=UPI003AF373DF